MRTIPTLLLASAAVLVCFRSDAQTAFTYQGRLNSGSPSSATNFDLQFVMYDSVSAGNAISFPITNTIAPAADGSFTVTLDFGPGIFTGAPRWLEIAVRPSLSSQSFTILSPRQALTPSPYAMQAMSSVNYAGTIADAQLSGNIARLNGNATFLGPVSFSPLLGAPFKVNNASLITNLNAQFLNGLDISAFSLTGHVHSASDITSGTIADARLSSNVPLLGRAQTFSASNTFTGVLIATNGSNTVAGTFAGNGGGITNLATSALVGSIPDAQLSPNVARLNGPDVFSGSTVFSPAAGPPFTVSSATQVTNLNADFLNGQHASAFWNLSGNSGTAGAILGTLDNQPLQLRANNVRALRLEPSVLGANVIGGSPGNLVTGGAGGAVLAGGGPANQVAANYGVVAGGTGNTVSGIAASVGGGTGNAATNFAASVPGGSANVAGGQYSFAAGQNALALHDGTLVWADYSSLAPFTSAAPNTVIFRAAGGVGIGTNNPQASLHVAGTAQVNGLRLTSGASAGAVLGSDASGNASWGQPPERSVANVTSPDVIGGHASNSVAPGIAGATLAGGGNAVSSNYVGGNYGTIGGGLGNIITADQATVGGGAFNRAFGNSAVVGGGSSNSATGNYATVAGGYQNSAALTGVVAGGTYNSANGTTAAILGGAGNTASGMQAAIAGGVTNTAGFRSFIGAGEFNSATGGDSVIGGGTQNTNRGAQAFIGGGQMNGAGGFAATVPGGYQNLANGLYSFAAGQQAQALNNGAFVWADGSSVLPFATTADNQFLLRAAGGVGINTTTPVGGGLSVAGPVNVDYTDQNIGTTAYALRFGDSSSLEGIGSRRTPGANQYGLDLYTFGVQRISITQSGNVGVGTNNPADKLSIAGSLRVDQGDQGTNLLGGIRFGAGNTGEGLGSRRSGSPNLYGLDFYTANNPRLSIANNGFIGLGTQTPGDMLQIDNYDTAIRLRNLNDGGVGALFENTFGALQLGMFNTSTNVYGQVAANSKRAFFGFDENGHVGSLANNLTSPSAPSFRNLLDDGAGNGSFSGNLYFGTTTRQMLNLWNSNYGLGVQNNTLYQRTDGNFAWYQSGSHNDNELNSGGGFTLMVLNSGGLTVNGTVLTSSDRNVKTNFSAIDPQLFLEKIAALPITRWNYTSDLGTAHIGPMAQDFQAAFGLGNDARHIATVDAEGVAFAAIQGLNQKVEELKAELARSTAENAVLRREMEQLREAVERLGSSSR